MSMEPPTPIDTEAMQRADIDIAKRFKALSGALKDVVEGLEARGDEFLYPHSELDDMFGARLSLNNVRARLQGLAQEVTDTIDQVYSALQHDPECGYVYKDDDGEYHCIGGEDDYDPDYAEAEALNVPVPDASNPFSVLGAQDTWGKVVIQFHGGAGACVACGNTDAARRQIVPPHLLPTDSSNVSANHQPLCDACALRWASMPTEAHFLASAMLLRQVPAGVESLSRNGQLGMAGADLHQRDGGTCRVCGLTDPDPKAFHRGHIISRHDARERKDGVAWRLPFVLSESPLNYVLMCPPCNVAIGPVSPNLRVGLRFLLKPWTSDPTAATIISARRAEAMQRVSEIRAERQNRLRHQ
ncbi:HNH endonuclease [Mycobacteroides franklinii]|uniref:HNH endonuclease n=1 Tax=Mycobacteroides franklinii TaxID=948102 RepID=UPI000991F587|nr:hypothetical protein [Mycobacteroides franklinii]